MDWDKAKQQAEQGLAEGQKLAEGFRARWAASQGFRYGVIILLTVVATLAVRQCA